MHPCKSQSEHIDEFHKLVGYFEARRRARDTRVLHKMTEAKGDGGEGLYVRPDLVKRDVEQLRQSHRKEAADSEVYTTMYEEWVAKHLDVAGIQQQNGLVEETNTTLLAKVCCFLIQSGLSKVFWAEDTTMSTYLVNRSPSSSIGFKAPVDMLGFSGWLASIKQGMLEPIKVKCIFLGYHEGILGNKI
nr:retrovirus-related Pol polyprotein from transposon TNT 1-94 [Tanacetum cinerariifolium]